MASGVTGSVSVALHPLVILNISDHWIRIRSQEGRPMQGMNDDALQEKWHLHITYRPSHVQVCCSVTECKDTFWRQILFFVSCSVIGALIGKQEGRNIEVMNSFELLSHTIDDRVHIDKEYYYTKEEQCEWFVCVKDMNTALLLLLVLWLISMKCSKWFPLRPISINKKSYCLLHPACVNCGVNF